MNQSTTKSAANDVEQAGKAIADLIREESNVVSTHGFRDLVQMVDRFHTAMTQDPQFCNHPSFQNFDEARRIFRMCLQEER